MGNTLQDAPLDVKPQLYLIPTPVGNLSDWTFRAVQVIREQITILLAEDTRRARILLQRYDLKVPPGGIYSFYRENEHRRLRQVRQWLQQGEILGYITDAGMPGFADPGFTLIRLCLQKGIPYTVLPGPSVILPALLLSGFPTDHFAFGGYFPRRHRQRTIAWLKQFPYTVVFFEAPTRLARTLLYLYEMLGDRWVAVVRELSKVHEEVRRGRLSQLAKYYLEHPPRGECTFVLAPPDYQPFANSSSQSSARNAFLDSSQP